MSQYKSNCLIPKHFPNYSTPGLIEPLNHITDSFRLKFSRNKTARHVPTRACQECEPRFCWRPWGYQKWRLRPAARWSGCSESALCPNQKSTAKTLHAWELVVVKLLENLYSRISACKSSRDEPQHRHKWQKLAQRSSIPELSAKLMMRWTGTESGKVCGRKEDRKVGFYCRSHRRFPLTS